jgi:thymidylate synthase
MAFHDSQYLDLVSRVLKDGVYKGDRTGTGTYSVFGYTMRFDLRDGTIPMLTSKKMHTKSIIHEILWYLQGADNARYLQDNEVTIWNEWADADGYLGPIYGKQWRSWDRVVPSEYETSPDGRMTYHITHDPIDQIANLVTKLRTNPDDRRMIVSAWNVADLGDMRLPPCHYVFQCYTRPLSQRERVLYASQQYSVYDLFGAPPDKIDALMDDAGVPRRELSLMLNQRSCDVGLGVPFNIVQYSILLRMLAEVTNMAPGEFIWNGGDIHIYTNHVAGLSEQLDRPLTYPSPTFNFSRVVESIDDFRYDDFVISGYESHARVVLPVAV